MPGRFGYRCGPFHGDTRISTRREGIERDRQQARLVKDEIERLLPDVEPDSTLYVADENLRVIYTNDEWRRFAEANKGIDLAGPRRDDSVLDSMGKKARERWAAIYDMLIKGSLPHYEEDFICSSPRERRVYRIRITAARDDDGEGPWLVHHTVPIDEKAEEREAMRRRLRALESDPDQVREEYQNLVLEPRVDVPGFQVAPFLEPHGDVGGDVLWHQRYDDGVTDLVVADAMGHGLQASVHASKLVLMLQSLAGPDRTLQDILASLNRGLLRNRPEHESAFATGVLIRFERDSTRIRCASFGHQGPMFSRSGAVPLKAGLALGMVDTVPRWPETELDLEEHGKRFLVFTDGITEQFDEDGEMYGEERLLETFRASLDVDVERMVQRIIEDLTTFRGSAIVKDDQTLFAVERVAEENR